VWTYRCRTFGKPLLQDYVRPWKGPDGYCGRSGGCGSCVDSGALAVRRGGRVRQRVGAMRSLAVWARS
jgi:hypothetical protein